MHLGHVLLTLESSVSQEYKSQSQTASLALLKQALRADANLDMLQVDKRWVRLNVPKPFVWHLKSHECRAMIFHLCRPIKCSRGLKKNEDFNENVINFEEETLTCSLDS